MRESLACTSTTGITTNVALVKSQFGGITPEHSMTWGVIEPSPGIFNFTGPDSIVSWAISNQKLIRGYTFVWHSQLPSWASSFNDRATLVGFYLEIFNEDGSLRNSIFSAVLGESFVTIAFQAARAADPNAKLYINDYSLDSKNAKVRGVVGRINSDTTKLIDSLGTQVHLSAGGTGGVQAAPTALAATGLDVAITELDIVGAAPNDYVAVARACIAVPQCVSITSWGNSWRAGSTPLLCDSNYSPKPAYTAILQALR
ncbi:glycoside hydrolase family 10 protein [Pluteus cervinus]|uniref:Glycoside hydrolase family 10 protein n=1 Tax=Pluteus cervinus TaxID=181527 RepID=A0ACD3B298_9AGAR|nr:glycoside hydrolase family 10 protein [Pluteus cervinus]